MTDFIHKPVLLIECIEGLAINTNGTYVDGTLGGGGHSAAIIASLGGSGRLIGIDRDGFALEAAKKRLDELDKPFILVRDKHENMRQVLQNLSVKAVDGFLLDLGVSSYQLDQPERGFSYRYDAPLDMRMDDRDISSAYNIVNEYPEKKLANIIKTYGEERYAKRIAKALCIKRTEKPIRTTLELSEIVADAVPRRHFREGNPAARTFQAIRIVVNEELTGLAHTIADMINFLKPGGRICIITFHSLEDRIVKQTFKYWANPCGCPREIPYCVCGKKPKLSLITKKPIVPGTEELAANPRAHSAKLRIAEGLNKL